MPGSASRMVRACRAVLLLVCCMAGYGVSGAAQEDQVTAAIPDQTQGTGQMRRAIPGVKLGNREDRLSLNPEQRKRMRALTDEELGQMKVLREDRSLTKEQKLKRFKQIREANHDRIKEILTPEQQKKYGETLAKERRFRENQRQEKLEKTQ